MVMNLDCTLTITNDGEIQNMNGTIINTPELSEFFLNKCSVKGVTVKYNSRLPKLHWIKYKNSYQNLNRRMILILISHIMHI